MLENNEKIESTPVEEVPDTFESASKQEEINLASYDKLMSLIEAQDVKGLREFISEEDPIDVAFILRGVMDNEDLVYLFKVVPNSLMADVFSYMDSEQQEKIVEAFTSTQISSLISKMSKDDLTDFVDDLPSNLVTKVLSQSTQEERDQINQLLNYAKDSAGSIMTTEYINFRPNMTCKEALAHVREVGEEVETINVGYVLDESRRLIGAVTIKDILLADDKALLKDIMDSDCFSITHSTDEEEVLVQMKKYDLTVIPVVDFERRLIGIITIDDILDVAEKEQTEDISRLAGFTPLEGTYLRTPAWKLAKSRLPWLVILMILDTLSVLILSSFEETLAMVAILTVFVPMITDTVGNAGGQATTVVVRAIALGEVGRKTYGKVMLKEFLTSLIVASVAALVNFGWVYLELSTGILSYDPTTQPAIWMVALIVSLTVFCVIVMAKLLGAILPIIGKLIHIDPALMSGPLITSLVDALALLFYLFLARMMLGF